MVVVPGARVEQEGELEVRIISLALIRHFRSAKTWQVRMADRTILNGSMCYVQCVHTAYTVLHHTSLAPRCANAIVTLCLYATDAPLQSI